MCHTPVVNSDDKIFKHAVSEDIKINKRMPTSLENRKTRSSSVRASDHFDGFYGRNRNLIAHLIGGLACLKIFMNQRIKLL